MISWVVIMLLFWHNQKLAQLGPASNIVRYFDSNNQWQSFVCSSYSLDKIYQYINIINGFLSSSTAFNFYTTKN